MDKGIDRTHRQGVGVWTYDAWALTYMLLSYSTMLHMHSIFSFFYFFRYRPLIISFNDRKKDKE